MRIFGLFGAILAALSLHADTACNCDPARPETMKDRQCSLCAEAEKHTAAPGVFFLKDINPRKPNRMLALPRHHTRELHPLSEMTAAQRMELWTAAIEKAKSLWGNDWAVAYNGDRVRTQCHTHMHIGKLLPGVEFGEVVIVATPAEIPVPKDGGAIWVHAVDGKLHAHPGDQIAETVLLR